MPSPPRPVSSSHQRDAFGLAARSRSDPQPDVASAISSGSPASAQLRERLHVPRVCSCRCAPCPRSRADGMARPCRSSSDSPASNTGGTRRRTSAASRPRSRVRSSSAADLDARGSRTFQSAATASPSAAREAAPTAAYWVRSSSCAFADHGISSQSRQIQSVSSSLPETDAVGGTLESRSSSSAFRCRRRRRTAPRARVARCRPRPRRRRTAFERRRSSRQTMITAREPMCFSSQTTLGTPSFGSRRRPRPGARASPARRRCRTATSSAAGR